MSNNHTALLPPPSNPTHDWTNFKLTTVLRDVEKRYISDALRDAGGSITAAAKLLGFQHHQSLASLINTRHRDLLPERTPIKKRPKHLMDHARVGKRSRYRRQEVA